MRRAYFNGKAAGATLTPLMANEWLLKGVDTQSEERGKGYGLGR
jgi:hypothetical protein